VTAVNKWLEGRRADNGTRRLVLLAAGCLVGAAAWWLDQTLMVTYAGRPDALFVSVGARDLLDDAAEPTLFAYLIFFGGLFSLRRWWWHTDEFRPKRFRVSSLLLTAMLAWLLSVIWAFPHGWAVVWAVVISSVVQLSSVWTPPEERRV
jgi:amino acid transporter